MSSLSSLALTDNPPIRPPAIESVEQMSGTWWVAHTKSRCEKRLAWDLMQRGVNYFLPLAERVRITRGRKHKVLMPLFTSYVFICGDDHDRAEALATNRVCQTLEVPDQALMARELAAIDRALQTGADLEPYPFAAVGEMCRVTAGPFCGFEGTVIQVRDGLRMVLEINALGQGASLEIEADLLEPA
jgi:transcriptional antiterminator RfaH